MKDSIFADQIRNMIKDGNVKGLKTEIKIEFNKYNIINIVHLRKFIIYDIKLINLNFDSAIYLSDP